MNLIPQPQILRHSAHGPRRGERGSAVIVVIALLAIVLLYLGANVRTLNSLGRELKLIERQQTRRLEQASKQTQKVEIRSWQSATNSIVKKSHPD
jgi:predicted metalloprotease